MISYPSPLKSHLIVPHVHQQQLTQSFDVMVELVTWMVAAAGEHGEQLDEI